MAIRYIARTPFTPTDRPFNFVYSDFEFTGISGNFTQGIYTLAIAELNNLLLGNSFNWAYVCSWGFTWELTSSIPRSISAFAGNPERRYLGNYTCLQSTFASHFGQINYQEQQVYGGQFIATNIRARHLNILDQGTEIGFQGIAIPRPSLSGVQVNNLVVGGTDDKAADVLRLFLFPGITGRVKIGYSAVLATDLPTNQPWRAIGL